MGYRPTRSRSRFLIASALLVFLTGCTADRYLMVPKNNLESVQQSVSAQRATLVTMEENAATRHEQLLNKNAQSTQTILDAIATQVEKPNCPPPEETPVCKAALAKSEQSARLEGKLIVGELEKFYLAGPGLVYNARIDSGAETSSIYARNVQPFERDGNNWVRFDVPVPGENSESWVTLEKEVSRWVRIIQANSEEAEHRVVVELQFAIGDHHQVAEFTLANRKNLTYDVLIGRNILRDVMLIDVGKEFATELPSSYLETNNGGEAE
ncbi:ATP-dependent zinc protease family protein [Marinobacter persicus]|jgi:hypothetical protein|uniref:Retropepsin-like aspartic endopeptidase domain-containing protein n=1 Tax=Marinobacter persicus TaxID=930118 RepID=A0A2S6G7C3_9GAMM|nr:RimK/LysX family protein [Marinobacter persicus]PPK52032.1 hypothetical protein BY455_108131 [Marinobacter persicus]PPK55068.1 hypothetical protein B0H24_1008131 [Marinobacter persicus]PPK56902.1 hypothetical protein BY454_12931 [Marinobacter persicus]